MPKELYLMRNAETLFDIHHKMQGWCDSPITEQGIRQAHAAGRMLRERGFKPDYAICSTSERCADTIEIVLAEACGEPLPYERDRRLREHGYGAYEGQDCFLMPPAPYAGFFADSGGETERQVVDRMGEVLTQAMERPDVSRVLAVSSPRASLLFLHDCSSHGGVASVDGDEGCMAWRYEYEDGEFLATEIILPSGH